ncbi:neuropeptide FF receptor 1-like isoform X2 [Actinia tenebrosa]|nr:neuropeptide FF receptor 1-like isoform X2 [Actinia tenebrosa]
MTSVGSTIRSTVQFLNCSENITMNCTNFTNASSTSASFMSEEKESMWSTITRITLCCLVFILNLLGNTMVCIVVNRSRKLRSSRNYYYGLFLVNLSVADMTVAIFIMPFVLMFYETGKYPFGFYGSTAACKLIPTLSLMCQGASIYSLASLTLQRYIGIVYPLKARLTLFRVKLVLTLVWFFAFLNAFPLIIVSDGVPTPKYNQYSCDEYWPNGWLRFGYTLYLFLFEYLVPLAIICMTYTKMALVLCNREKEFEGIRSCTKKTK